MHNRETVEIEDRSGLRKAAGGPLWSVFDWLIAALLGLAFTVPFLGKPIHIDDPVVLRVSRNVLLDPGDPLAGRMDWFGHELPLWEVTTNPPLLSYWLAPALAFFGADEAALHACMIPFWIALALGLRLLSGRFTGRTWLPALFAIASPAFLVSSNLMRDVPAAGLLCLGLGLFVAGVDRGRRRWLALGSLICGLAAVTKYSAALAIPLLAAYALSRKPRLALWSLGAGVPLLAWCLQTQFRYGWIHPLYLMSGSHPNRTSNPIDQFFAAIAIVGCSLYLAPALTAAARRWAPISLAVAAVAAILAALWAYRAEAPGAQALFWTAAGAVVAWMAFREGLAFPGRCRDGVFLAGWAAAFVVFSVWLAPFQAVRHLLPALPPMTLLAFRFIDRRTPGGDPWRWLLILLLTAQIGMAFAVNAADAEYASSYRDFAARFRSRPQEHGTVWFVGHWGWMHYAERAGFRQLHRDGPPPREGDVLIWPKRVHIGDALSGRLEFRESLQLEDEVVYEGRIPLRTMNFECAAFYATIRGNLPYCWQTAPLESFRVFRVR